MVPYMLTCNLGSGDLHFYFLIPWELCSLQSGSDEGVKICCTIIGPHPPADGDVTSLDASSSISLLLIVTSTFSGFMSVWMMPQCVCM